jgi:cullin 1
MPDSTADQLSGRKLTWLWHVSKGEIRTTYLSQKYIFMVSAYQFAILAQFNDDDSRTYTDIQEGTRLADSVLKPSMAHLVKAKVLLQPSANSYGLNLNFKSKKVRFA